MSAKKKILAIAMVFALLLNFAAFGASASLGDGLMTTLDIDLVVGTGTGAGFTPLATSDQPPAGSVLTVRLVPTSDFYVASQCIRINVEREFFTWVSASFQLNPACPYFNAVSSFSGNYGTIPESTFTATSAYGPGLGSTMYAQYSAGQITCVAASNAPNGGFGEMYNGTWFCEFQLNVIKDITAGSDARVYIDRIWLRNTTNTSGGMYFNKCATADTTSSSATLASKFDCQLDVAGADISLPLTVNSTVTFDSTGGSPVAPLTGAVGSPLTPPANPVKAGYTFGGWNPPLPPVFPEQNLTVTALWNINSYNLKYMVDGGIYNSFQVQYMAQLPGVAPPVKEGYDFDRWEPTPPAQMPAADVTLNAVFTPKQYTVTFDANGGAGGWSQQRAYGSPLVAPTVTRNYYTFSGWSPAPPATVPLGGGMYVAQWTINKTSVTFNSNGGSPVAPLTGDIYSPLTPPSNPVKTGYTFDRWEPALPQTFPEQNLTVTAVWTPNVYDAIFMVDGVEYARIPTAYGTAITLPAAPEKDGFIFTGWNPVPGTMGAGNETFEAQFTNAVTSVMITLDDSDIGPTHAVKVPMFTMFKDYPVQLGYVTNADPSFRVEFTSDNDKVTVDSSGLVTNTGNVGRDAVITVTVYDASDNPVATDSVQISFYKFKWEMLFNWLMQILALLGFGA
ncbi:MAG TPA: InlB B-repeat-containing protein [Clostridiales bacterium]|nr:InlB B-repeat-containing protein [Clostridiales bacterium]HQK74222.1 InlB B-repeat-containing protein [Clostridiales bacterium]